MAAYLDMKGLERFKQKIETMTMVGASENSPGKAGLVPAASDGETNKLLCSDGNWKDLNNDISTTITVNSSEWNADTLTVSKTVSITGNVIRSSISPSQELSEDALFDIFDCDVIATMSGNTITFTASKKPANNLIFNVDLGIEVLA